MGTHSDNFQACIYEVCDQACFLFFPFFFCHVMFCVNTYEMM